MTESTTATMCPKTGIYLRQRTETAHIRTYTTEVTRAEHEELVLVPDETQEGVYRAKVTLDIIYKDPATVKAALTAIVVGREITALPAREECYIEQVSISSEMITVTLKFVLENVNIMAINIEGRIVDHVDQNKAFPA